jgi:hypothetical protein
MSSHLGRELTNTPARVAGLLPMIIVDAMVPKGCLTLDRHRRLSEIGLVFPKPRAIVDDLISIRGAN